MAEHESHIPAIEQLAAVGPPELAKPGSSAGAVTAGVFWDALAEFTIVAERSLLTLVDSAHSMPGVAALEWELEVADGSAGASARALLALDEAYLMALCLVLLHEPGGGFGAPLDPAEDQLARFLQLAINRDRLLANVLEDVRYLGLGLAVEEARAGSFIAKVKPRRALAHPSAADQPWHKDRNFIVACLALALSTLAYVNPHDPPEPKPPAPPIVVVVQAPLGLPAGWDAGLTKAAANTSSQLRGTAPDGAPIGVLVAGENVRPGAP